MTRSVCANCANGVKRRRGFEPRLNFAANSWKNFLASNPPESSRAEIVPGLFETQFLHCIPSALMQNYPCQKCSQTKIFQELEPCRTRSGAPKRDPRQLYEQAAPRPQIV